MDIGKWFKTCTIDHASDIQTLQSYHGGGSAGRVGHYDIEQRLRALESTVDRLLRSDDVRKELPATPIPKPRQRKAGGKEEVRVVQDHEQ